MKTAKQTAHTHVYTRRNEKSTIETCACGKWQHTENNKNPVIEEVKTTHTPTPWRIDPKDGSQIQHENGIYGIACCNFNRRGKEDFYNANYIVKCANSHTALVEALEEIKEGLESTKYTQKEMLNIINEALKQAKGE